MTKIKDNDFMFVVESKNIILETFLGNLSGLPTIRFTAIFKNNFQSFQLTRELRIILGCK